MALVTIEGVYRNGQIEMVETPAATEETRVIITFLPKTDAAEVQRQKDERNAARERLFARMKAGIDFGGERFNRAEIYEDRINELEARSDRQ